MMKARIKNHILFVLLFLLITVSVGFAAEAADVWSILYNRSKTYEQRYEIMLNIAELEDRDMAPFLSSALNDLILTWRNPVNSNQLTLHNQLMELIVEQLGSLKARDSADYLFTVVKETEEPFLKREALIALGKVGGKTYVDEIAMLLRNLNFGPAKAAQAEEVVAYGCIAALERFKEPIGYEPVFFASIGWYTDRIKSKAGRALEVILADPSEVLGNIIKNDSIFKVKLQALNQEEKSNAPTEKKIAVATIAMDQGLVNVGQTVIEQQTLQNLRIKAIEMLTILKFDSIRAISLMEEILYKNYDINEKLSAIQALGFCPKTEAAETLAKFLAELNERQESGLLDKDNRIVISTIRALGSTKNKLAHPELLRVKYAGYGFGVVRAAEEAIKKLNK